MPDGSHDNPELDAFAASLDDMLERVSSSTRSEQETRQEERPVPARREQRPRVEPTATSASAPPLATLSARLPVPPQTMPVVGGAPPRSRRLTLGVVALIGFGAVFAWIGLRHEATPDDPLSIENLPPTAAGAALKLPAPRALVAAASQATSQGDAPPMPAIAIDPDASTEGVMLDQFRHGSAADAAPQTPAFAIARYDNLPAASSGWNVLMPLGVEEVFALVPVTSRLRELDDLRGRRINVGAEGTPRARSSEALYRTLFGQPLPSAPLRSASRESALTAMLRGQGLDAILLFDGQPSSWLAALPAETRLQLKILRFDPTRRSGQRALQAYLATTVTPSLVTEPAPVPTLGEVTFLVASGQQANSPDLVRRLCERLPALRAGGHPKWKDIDPALQLPIRLPRSRDIESAAHACALPPSPATPSSGALS